MSRLLISNPFCLSLLLNWTVRYSYALLNPTKNVLYEPVEIEVSRKASIQIYLAYRCKLATIIQLHFSLLVVARSRSS